jgi:hypothetical protein
VLSNNGSDSFESKSVQACGGTGDLDTVAVVDLDGDGDLDVITASALARSIFLTLNTGNGVLGDIRTFAASQAIRVAAKDLDLDGNPDLAVANRNTGTVAVLLTSLSSPTVPDLDRNGVPDGCDPDCNGNDTIDGLDLLSGTSRDVDSNGVPDECQPDCDGSGLPDSYEIGQGTVPDCNGNGLPDSCDIARGTSTDANGDGVPDECPPPGGRRLPGDANGDGSLDISDAVMVLGVLFTGSAKAFPCGDGLATDAGNVALLDWQPDGAIDISDGVAMLSHLFLGGRPHALAVPGEAGACARIVGCADGTGCR